MREARLIYRQMQALKLASALLLVNFPLESGEIHGTVTGPDGLPIKDVCVEGLTLGCKRTDAAGRYTWQPPVAAPTFRPHVMWFHAEGFRPVVLPVKPGIDVVNAQLVPNGNTLWSVSVCDGSGSFAAGRNLAVRLTNDVKDGGLAHAVDVTARYVNYTHHDKTFHIALTFAGLVDAWPGEVRYLASRSFSQRTWASNAGLTGFNGRGIDKNGTYWRSIGTYDGMEVIEYVGVPKQVAEIFDHILDSVCVVPRK